MSKKPQWSKRRLRCFVSRGVMTIEIGVDALAFAAIHSPDRWDEAMREPAERFAVTNATRFAKDVVHELLDEAEDGSSLLTNVIDAACEKAIEQGSQWFADKLEDEASPPKPSEGRGE